MTIEGTAIFNLFFNLMIIRGVDVSEVGCFFGKEQKYIQFIVHRTTYHTIIIAVM